MRTSVGVSALDVEGVGEELISVDVEKLNWLEELEEHIGDTRDTSPNSGSGGGTAHKFIAADGG